MVLRSWVEPHHGGYGVRAFGRQRQGLRCCRSALALTAPRGIVQIVFVFSAPQRRTVIGRGSGEYFGTLQHARATSVKGARMYA